MPVSLTGRTVSHYKIVEEISRGGMGVVYRATDTRLNRDVALKVLPPELVADADRRERFVREARAASALEHPNIAVIHDIGDVDGVSFIAMELVRGDKLSAAIANGQFAAHPGRALEVAAEIAEGLARAHTQGIVHRDLKPANVMLTEDGHAKVIDFGLAKLLSSLSGDGDTVTAGATDPAVVLGTVSYMAPEQARGGAIDHRTDIFSFGILLYELFTGSLPFKGHSSIETMHAILHDPPAPLRLGASAMPAAAASDVQRIIEKCLAKDPEARYQGMKDLVVDLRAARRRLDTASMTATTPMMPSSAPRSQRWLIGFASAAVLAAIGLWAWTESRSPIAQATGTRPSVAVLHFENNTGNASMDWLRTGLADMLVTDLSQSPDVEVLSTDRLVQILGDLGRLDDPQISFETVQELARRAHVQNVLLGSYVKAGNTIRISVRLQDAATGKIISTERVDAINEASLFPTIDDLTRRVKTRFAPASGTMFGGLLRAPASRVETVGLDHDLTDVTTSSMEAYRHYAAGIEHHLRGRYLDALPHFERAVKVDPDFALAYVKMAVGTSNMGRSNESDQHAKRALELVNRLTPRERYYIEGFYYSLRIDGTARAIEAYEHGLALYPDHSASRNNVGLLYLRTDQLDKAIAHYEMLRERGFEFSGAVSNLAAGYITAGRPDEGIAALADVAGRYPALAAAHRNLGFRSASVNRLDQAQAAYDRALALRPNFPPALFGLGMIATLRDDFAAARRIGRQLTGGATPNVRFLGFEIIAIVDLLAGRTADAVKVLQRAIDDQGPGGSNQSTTLRAIVAEVLMARGQRQAAAVEAERAIAESRGGSTLLDGLLIGSIAGSAAARREFQRVADSLPHGSDKATPFLTDAIVAIEAGRAAEGLGLLQQFAPHVPPGPIGQTARQPRVMLEYWSGRARFAQQDDAAAAGHFTEVVNAGFGRVVMPFEYVRSFYYLAQIADRAGDRAKAREYYGRFLTYWKDGDIDRDKVQEALKKSH
jgi:serine/threonine protein kinase/Tfp pilus assembly protein PilF